MNTSINGRHLTVRQDLRDAIDKKLSKFDRFFPEDASASVTCRCEHDDKIVEITIVSKGTIFRAEKAGNTFQSSLDDCLEAIERQIRKNKTRLEKKMKSAISVPEETSINVEEEAQFDVRRKSYPIRPMTLEEAILQMNLLNHSFYLFLDADSLKMCVAYRRHDNTYGLIVPEE